MITTEELEKRAGVLFTIAQTVAIAPDGTITIETRELLNQKLLGLLNLLDVK